MVISVIALAIKTKLVVTGAVARFEGAVHLFRHMEFGVVAMGLDHARGGIQNYGAVHLLLTP